MATTRDLRAASVLLGLFVFAIASQVVDLAVGAPEVGVRVGVIVVAAVGAVLTGLWIARQKRVPPPVPRQLTPAPEDAPDDPGTAEATSVRG
jgi:hypothetical protein